MQPSQHILSGVMIAAGLCVPAMANLNAGLGHKLGSPLTAVLLLCLVAMVAAATLTAFTGDVFRLTLEGVTPLHLCGGLLFIFYMMSITYAAPRLGLGNAIFLVLLGQLVSAAAIDHLGLIGAAITPLSPKRLVGITLMSFGVYLAHSGAASSSNQLDSHCDGNCLGQKHDKY